MGGFVIGGSPGRFNLLGRPIRSGADKPPSGGEQELYFDDLVRIKALATNALTDGFGMVADGVADDTAAISTAITAAMNNPGNMWGRYHCLYFPGDVNAKRIYRIRNLIRNDIKDLYILGDNDSSVIQVPPGSSDVPFIQWTDARHVRITNMAFDYNNGVKWGGWKYYRSHDIHMSYNHFYDSKPRGPLVDNTGDRWAFLFGKLGTTLADASTDVYIGYNLIEDLQLEVDQVNRAMIERNTVLRCPTTTAIGVFSVGPDSWCMDTTIRDNLIFDSDNHDICVLVDSGTHHRMTVKRLNVTGNIAYRTRRENKIPFSFGATVTTGNQLGHDWQDINISGNIVHLDPALPKLNAINVFRLLGASGSNLHFVRGRFCNNQVYGNGKGITGTGFMQIRGAQSMLFQGNSVRNGGNAAFGLAVINEMEDNVITDNVMEVDGTAVYQIQNSLNGSTKPTKGLRNWYIGNPTALVNKSGLNTVGDGFDNPLSAIYPGKELMASKVWDPASVEAGASVLTTLPMFDVAIGDFIQVSFSLALGGLSLSAEVTTAGTVGVAGVITATLRNSTAGAVDLGSGTISVMAKKAA